MLAVFWGYTAVRNDQTTVNGSSVDYTYGPTVGGAWRYSGETEWFHVRERSNGTSGTRFDGDPTNEAVSNNLQFGRSGEQLAYVNGTYYQTFWDYTFEVTNGTDSWRVGVVDIDFNGNDTISGTTENGYYLVFPDGLPPANTNLTVVGVVENDDYATHGALGGSVVCFASGTLIETAEGEVKVEELKAGDVVITRDNGPQKLVWTGRREVEAMGAMAPVEFAKGAIGNRRRLVVSPQHRMLIAGWQAELLFGESEVLVKAKDLIDGSSVRRVEGGRVSYHHIMFENHEIVTAEGVPSESFQPGAQAVGALEADCAAELFALFPEIANDPEVGGSSARMSLKSYEGAVLKAA